MYVLVVFPFFVGIIIVQNSISLSILFIIDANFIITSNHDLPLYNRY